MKTAPDFVAQEDIQGMMPSSSTGTVSTARLWGEIVLSPARGSYKQPGHRGDKR